MLAKAFNAVHGYYEPEVKWWRRDLETLADDYAKDFTLYRRNTGHEDNAKLLAFLDSQLESGHVLVDANICNGVLQAKVIPITELTKREPRLVFKDEVVQIDYCDMRLSHDHRAFLAEFDFDLDAVMYNYILSNVKSFTEYLLANGYVREVRNTTLYMRDNLELEVSSK